MSERDFEKAGNIETVAIGGPERPRPHERPKDSPERPSWSPGGRKSKPDLIMQATGRPFDHRPLDSKNEPPKKDWGYAIKVLALFGSSAGIMLYLGKVIIASGGGAYLLAAGAAVFLWAIIYPYYREWRNKD